MKICCVYHSIDLDGWMSAGIVKHWYEKKCKDDYKETIKLTNQNLIKRYEMQDSLNFIGYNYGQPIPDLSEYDQVIMCDISFPKEEMWNLGNKLNNNFIWIDHHISAIKDIDGAVKGLDDLIPETTMKPINGLRNTKLAACELTWLYFMTDINKTHWDDEDVKNMPEIIRLLGLYDSFRHKNTNEEIKVLEFQYGARQCISNYEEAYYYLVNKTNEDGIPNEDMIHYSGKEIYRYLCTEAKQTYKNGFEIFFHIIDNTIKKDKNSENIVHSEIFNYKFICINKERFNPINFGINYHKDEYDGCACFHYANGMWNFSLYNDNGKVDCSTIAKQYGGGGHFSASGFRVNDKEFLKIINSGRGN